MNDPLPRILELLHTPDPESIRQGVELTVAFNDPFLFATLLGQCQIEQGVLGLGPPLPYRGAQKEEEAIYAAVLSLLGHAPRPELLPPSLDRRRLSWLDLSRRNAPVPASLRLLPNLRWLNLSRCGLAALPEWIGEFERLEVLVVRDNALASLPASLNRLTRLRLLDASGNQLSAVPPWLLSMPGLEDVFLDNNDLRHVSGDSIGSRLRHLSLSCNRLQAVALDLRALETVVLDGNAPALARLSRTPPLRRVLPESTLRPVSPLCAPLPDVDELVLRCGDRELRTWRGARGWEMDWQDDASIRTLAALLCAPPNVSRALSQPRVHAMALPWGERQARQVLLKLAASREVAASVAPLESAVIEAADALFHGEISPEALQPLRDEAELVTLHLRAWLEASAMSRHLLATRRMKPSRKSANEVPGNIQRSLLLALQELGSMIDDLFSDRPRAALREWLPPQELPTSAHLCSIALNAALCVWFGPGIATATLD